MPKDLRDMPRPPSDNGRGLHGSLSADWNGGEPGYAFWINELVQLGVKWFKVVDDHGSSAALCEQLLAAGIFPVVRILRRDPAPNDSPEPNPGHLGRPEEETLRKLVALGVRYFETNNEPNRSIEWKHNAMPSNPLEAAKLVVLNWLFDARLILEAGGYPGLPALSSGGSLDLLGALVALGRHNILLEGCWLAVHNYALNRPLDFPDDVVNRMGQALTREQYAHAEFTEWAWWNNSQQHAESLEQINTLRETRRAPTQTIQQEHACFREFEFYNALALKYLGRSIPILSTEGGFQIGRRDDPRYPRITPALHRDLTVAMFEWMQRQAPDYYFAAMPVALVGGQGREQDAWYSTYWRDAFTQGTDGFDGFPKIAVPQANLADRLPVVEAVKQMANLPRRLPGMQPTPPVALETSKPPAPPERRSLRPGLANLFPDEPAPARASAPIAAPQDAPVELPPPPQVSKPITPPQDAPVELPPPPQVSKPITPPQDAPVELPPPQVSKPITPPQDAPVELPPPPQVSAPTVLPETPAPAAPVFAAEPPPLIEELVQEPSPLIEEISAPPIEPPRPVGEEISTPVAPPIERVELPYDVEWDFRLDALNVTVELAETQRGQPYWRLVSALYEGPGESGDSHQVFYAVLNEEQNPVAHQNVWQGWSDNQTNAVTNHHGQAAIPLWQAYNPNGGEAGPYAAWVEGLPSDRVVGLGLPLKRHVNFRLTWRRTIARR